MRACAAGFLCSKRRFAAVAGAVFVLILPGSVQGQGAKVSPQATAEDVLAAVVHQSAVIFAGEVYAIRVPKGVNNSVGGGQPSARPDAVEVEFRVDMGIRGTSIGNNYVLRMPLAAWQQAPPFALHQHSVTFLKPADAAGLSGPVEGEADLPGMDLGVMPVDRANGADMTRMLRMVTAASAPTPPAPGMAARPPSVSDVTTQAGEDTLISGSNQGRMPELRNNNVPFLALVRDVTVLSAAEAPPAASATATQ